jgi:Na+-driven multidrug efflux pump
MLLYLGHATVQFESAIAEAITAVQETVEHTVEYRGLPVCLRNVIRVFQGCYKGVTRVLQGCYRGVSSALVVRVK